MLIKIGDFEFTSVWDGVFYKKLSRYPAVSDWEKRNIIEFVEYEASHGRECRIECENADVLEEVELALNNRESYRNIPRPALITECTACARRELREETGITAGTFSKIGHFVSHDTIYETFLCVTDCPKDCVALQEGETVSYRWISEEELISFVNSDAMIDVQYQRYLPWLKKMGYVRSEAARPGDAG